MGNVMRYLFLVFVVAGIAYADVANNGDCANEETVSALDGKSVNTYAQIAGTISQSGPVDNDDYYKFKLNATGRIVVQYYSLNGAKLYIGTSDCASTPKVAQSNSNNDMWYENSFEITSGDTVHIHVARTVTGNAQQYWINIHFIPYGYCQTHGLSTGFHMINPDNVKSHTFEIFCDDSSPRRDLVALPMKDVYNNFIYSMDSLASTDYYTEASSNSTQFNAVEINANTMEVITPNVNTPTDKTNYKIMGKGFSNINLVGTPFAIDWTNTSLTNCTTSKLRKAYYGQAVKINTLDYDSKAICSVNNMKLKLLNDYQYVEYQSNEVLGKSCKDMAENVPTNILDSASIQGHFYISPLGNSRSYQGTDITKAYERPVVSYCWYQADLKNVWTFFLALDGFPTTKKDDLIGKIDSCSKSGLSPFVPNSEDTFERTRGFLASKKTEWSGYTGTIDEKVRVLHPGNTYYLGTEQSSTIWPYGSFGVYFPYSGNHDKTGASKDWGNGDSHSPGWMSGSPMHNIPSILTDYARKDNDSGTSTRDYYSWGSYSNTDSPNTDSVYTYSDTMGAKGWVSILGAGGLNKTDKWFISRTGAGKNFDRSTTDYPYFEPNGNYDAGAWLNFLYDDQGRVRHTDDWNSNYPYYDYMCMAADNYDFTDRYGLILQGPFGVIDSTIASGSEISNKKLYTKVVANKIDVDIIVFNDALTALESSKNVSAGIFLRDITKDANGNETPNDLQYFGQIGLNASNDYSTQGKARIPLNKTGSLLWSKADKRMFFEFRFCNQTNMVWTDCWNKSGNTATCKSDKESYCMIGNSDDFAVRPPNFPVSATPLIIKASDATFGITATNNTNGYSGIASITTAIAEQKTSCTVNNNFFPSDSFVFSGSVIPESKSKTGLSFKDVADVNVSVKDADWTSIDQPNDCVFGGNSIIADANGKVGCNIETNTTVKVVPYDVKASNITQSSWAYRSWTDAHIAAFSADITAYKDDKLKVSDNFDKNCYSSDSNVAFVTAVSGKKANGTTDYTLNDIVFTGTSSDTLSNPFGTVTVLATNFTKGVATTKFDMYSNKADIANPESPLVFTIKSLAVGSYDKVDNNKDTSFIYGRVRMPNAMADYNAAGMDVRAYAEVYASDSAKLPTGNAWVLSPGTSNWWVNVLDSANNTSKNRYIQTNDTLGNPPSNPASYNAAYKSVANGIITTTITVPANQDQKPILHLDVPSYLWYSLTSTSYSFAASTNCTQHPCGIVEIFSTADTNWFGSGDNKGNQSINTTPKGKRKPKVNW
jgi:hypothetical protein